MALIPVSINPKGPKKTGWDSLAQALSMAATAVNIGNGVKDLTSGEVPEKPPGNTPTSAEDMAKSGADLIQTNPQLRRYSLTPRRIA